MLVVTGQVPTSKIGTDAFQEADIVGLTLPITKANFPREIPAQGAPTAYR